MDPLQSQITTHHTHLPSPNPSSPSFHLHLTRLTDTLFIWVGAGRPTASKISSGLSGAGLDVEGEGALEERRLAGDWAVAMPARGNIPVTATSVFRSAASDLALPMAQRLARKFPSNQVHLSLSLPHSLTASSGPLADPYASRTLLLVEKELGRWVGEIVAPEKGNA